MTSNQINLRELAVARDEAANEIAMCDAGSEEEAMWSIEWNDLSNFIDIILSGRSRFEEN